MASKGTPMTMVHLDADTLEMAKFTFRADFFCKGCKGDICEYCFSFKEDLCEMRPRDGPRRGVCREISLLTKGITCQFCKTFYCSRHSAGQDDYSRPLFSCLFGHLLIEIGSILRPIVPKAAPAEGRETGYYPGFGPRILLVLNAGEELQNAQSNKIGECRICAKRACDMRIPGATRICPPYPSLVHKFHHIFLELAAAASVVIMTQTSREGQGCSPHQCGK